MYRQAVAIAALLAAGYVLAGALSTPTLRLGNDTYRYATTTLTLLGEPPAEARARALDAYCAGEAARKHRRAIADPARVDPAPLEAELAGQCVDANTAGLAPVSDRYDAIFDARIGYPLLAAPFVAVLDVVRGMWLASALCTALAGALVFVLLRSWRVPSSVAAAGQVLVYVSPIGTWGTWALAEGPGALATIAAMVGAVWLCERRRLVQGQVLLLGGLLAGVAVKYSTGELVAAALTVSAAAAVVLSSRARHRGTLLVCAISAATTVAAATLASRMGWPGIEDTLQDKFTGHFARADVADPWHRMMEQSLVFWNQWADTTLAEPMLLAAVAAGAWGLHRAGVAGAVVVGGVSATGVVLQAVHPVASQGDRLLAPVWIVVAVGVPLAVAAVRRRHVQSSPSRVRRGSAARAQPARIAGLHGWDERRPGAHRAAHRPSSAATSRPAAPMPARTARVPSRAPTVRHVADAGRR